jgi:hypothetical protein
MLKMTRETANQWASAIGSFVLGAVCSAIIGEITVKLLWSSEQAAISEINKNAGIDEFAVILRPVEQNPRVKEEKNFTDLTILTCSDNELPQNTSRLIVDAALEEKFGSIKLGVIEPSTRLHRILRGYVSAVYDADHPERNEIGRVFPMISSLSSSVPFQALANTGEKSEWRLTLFVC